MQSMLGKSLTTILFFWLVCKTIIWRTTHVTSGLRAALAIDEPQGPPLTGGDTSGSIAWNLVWLLLRMISHSTHTPQACNFNTKGFKEIFFFVVFYLMF